MPRDTWHKISTIVKTDKSFFSFCFFSLSSSRKLFFFSTREPETHGQARWLACCVMWTEAFGEERLGFICATEMWQEREVRLENTNQLTLINKTFFFGRFFWICLNPKLYLQRFLRVSQGLNPLNEKRGYRIKNNERKVIEGVFLVCI